ncbi:MAG: hypothetical protein ACTSPB_00465 [Candidatus Thorarchaeota archaeon]
MAGVGWNWCKECESKRQGIKKKKNEGFKKKLGDNDGVFICGGRIFKVIDEKIFVCPIKSDGTVDVSKKSVANEMALDCVEKLVEMAGIRVEELKRGVN